MSLRVNFLLKMSKRGNKKLSLSQRERESVRERDLEVNVGNGKMVQFFERTKFGCSVSKSRKYWSV